MEILTQPVNELINQQKFVDSNISYDLETGIKKAQEQFRKGNYVVFDDKFLNSFLERKRKQYFHQ